MKNMGNIRSLISDVLQQSVYSIYCIREFKTFQIEGEMCKYRYKVLKELLEILIEINACRINVRLSLVIQLNLASSLFDSFLLYSVS